MNDYPKKKLFFRLVNAHGLLTDFLHRVILVTFILPLRRKGSDSIPDSKKKKILKRYVNCKFLERSLQFVMVSALFGL